MSLMFFGKRQRGLGMIEVLVAGLVFALGVLGLSTMQMKAKRTSYDALQRSLATNLARDMAARMRSNPTALASYSALPFVGGVISDTEPSPNCKSATCNAAQLANHDLWEWEQALEGASEMAGDNKTGGLTAPTGCIVHNNGLVTITVAWEGFGGKANPTGSTCGENLNLYGTNNINRKIVVLNTYIEVI